MAVDPIMLEATVRSTLNTTAKRRMVVLEPLRLNIQNFNDKSMPKSFQVPDFPENPEKGSHSVAFGLGVTSAAVPRVGVIAISSDFLDDFPSLSCIIVSYTMS